MSEPQGSGTGEGSTQRLPVVERDTHPGAAPSPDRHEPGPPDASGSGRAGRFWSVRRVPAGLVALLLLLLAGAFLYDVVAVRAGRSALGWRRDL
ncbi:hypothetical protein G3I66_24750, partial [Streptomyces rubrogriseus]|nr:hypothetical protein [Streptomyces rubrogriseus]